VIDLEVYTGFILAGLSVSFLHAILPNHWLPFVLAGRAQKWSMGKTLSVVTLAGGGHVLITTVLGVLIVWMGVVLTEYVAEWADPLASGVLILFGLYYIVQHFRGVGHSHLHIPGLDHDQHDQHELPRDDHGSDHHGHDHGDPYQGHSRPGSDHTSHDHGDHDNDHKDLHDHSVSDTRFSPDKVAVVSLIALLTFSPCEGFLPIYLTAWPHGWTIFVLLSGVLAVGTLSGMLVFTGLTFLGVQHLEMPWLERFENLILGGVLILLGIGVVLFHHH
jgi:putative Mn2+ efflux pump MntP